MTSASIRSVLANRPMARAKSRIWRGLTTTTGSPAPANPAATTCSNPPVASSATRPGFSCPTRSARLLTPSTSRATLKASPAGRTNPSNRSLLTSMPTNTSRSMTLPCKSGLGTEQLFGRLGAVGGESRSPTGLLALGSVDLPPTSPARTLREPAPFAEIQGRGPSRSDGRVRCLDAAYPPHPLAYARPPLPPKGRRGFQCQCTPAQTLRLNA